MARSTRAALAVLAGLNLLAALSGGLVRVGLWSVQAAGPRGPGAVVSHGGLMMFGFFGTLIALERAVALQRGAWVPALCGLAGLLAWTLPDPLGPWPGGAQLPPALAVAGALGLSGLYAWAWRHRAGSPAARRALALPLAVEASGAVALVVAALAWSHDELLLMRAAGSAFLVLTIAGERRELMRLVPLPPAAARGFLVGWVAGGLLLAGLTVAVLGQGADSTSAVWALRLGWALLAALALWLMRYDVARRQWKAGGWAGHTAQCLLVGYGWLAAAAVFGLAGQGVAWHLLWLGFVFAMVFGHAPIMLPALAGWRPRPTRWARLPLFIMGASLGLRIVASVGPWPEAMALAGAGHALAVASFAAVMARAVIKSS